MRGRKEDHDAHWVPKSGSRASFTQDLSKCLRECVYVCVLANRETRLDVTSEYIHVRTRARGARE